MRRANRRSALIFALLTWAIFALPLLAQTTGATSYREFFGANGRLIIWIVAELHLMFAAFVLGVPIFAVIVEAIGAKTGDIRYDNLAHEFTKLLTAAFSTTAAFGAVLTFALFGLYPRFMDFLVGIFHTSMYVYALLFFAEAFCLYLYYYSWDRLKNRKGIHISLGILLNVIGTVIMGIANAWATYMMSPTGIDQETGAFVGSTWEAIANPLWLPLIYHRFLGNVAFGGFICGAYAAVRFLMTKDPSEKEHYDWMGYIGNFIGLAALIPLPFAGYYLGREVYSVSPLMGVNMMGGTFSWTFIIQAVLIGMLFIGGNYYLWTGMQRIKGSERYTKYIKYINIILILCFAIWLTPHNLPLSPEEQIMMGGQYHPVLKFFGLMSAKNAVVNFIILSTFFSFLIYRRANKGKPLPFAEHGVTAKVVLILTALFTILFLGWYALGLTTLDPAEMDLAAETKSYFYLPAGLLFAQMIIIVLSIPMAFANRGLWAQSLIFAVTTISAVFILGIYGYVIMTVANPFLRELAVCQVLLVLSCLIMNSVVDIFLYRKAEILGGMNWGKMPPRSQYALILLCVTIVLLMGLMGYIRSGLREDWHVYGVMQDTSAVAFTPTMAYMTKVVGGISFVFLALVTFVFWISSLGEKRKVTGRDGQADVMSAVSGGQ